MLKTIAKERAQIKEHMQGGAEYIVREALITQEQMGEHCRLLSKITLSPGGEIAHHEHHQETEMYYILKGIGVYEEDGQEVVVEAGDVTFCDEGHGHGLKNTGETELDMIAVILKK